MPVRTNQTTILSAARELTQALLQPRLSSSFLPLAHNHFQSLLELAKFSKNPSLMMPLIPDPTVVTLLILMMKLKIIIIILILQLPMKLKILYRHPPLKLKLFTIFQG